MMPHMNNIVLIFLYA